MCGCKLDSYSTGLGTVTGHCKQRNKPSGCTKEVEFIRQTQLTGYQLFKNDSVLCGYLLSYKFKKFFKFSSVGNGVVKEFDSVLIKKA